MFRYLKAQTDKGIPIGELAELGNEEILERTKTAMVSAPRIQVRPEGLLAELVAAVLSHDRITFERKLNGAISVIPFEESLIGILLPLEERVGQLWHEGKLSVAQEHYVTKQIQQKVYAAMNQLRTVDHGPSVVVACPPQELHELGAQTVAYMCSARGCRTHYLGGDVPIEELGKYCEQIRPALTLLSVTIPLLEPERLAQDLSLMVCPLTSVGIGGYGIGDARPDFEKENIKVFKDLHELEAHLLTLVA